jgi:excisionase family DNA binding protein
MERVPVNSYLNAEEAANFLKIKKRYLYKLTHHRRIKFYKPGGKNLLFKEEDLVNYVENGKSVCNEW